MMARERRRHAARQKFTARNDVSPLSQKPAKVLSFIVPFCWF
jgi:hypothetical protein